MYNNFLIIGAARSGLSSAKYLLSQGKNVILSDMNEALLKESKSLFPSLSDEHFIFGQQPKPSQLNVDCIIISPGIPLNIPPIEEAKQLGIQVIGEIELAYLANRAKLIGISGTNGKTTTTSLVGHLLESGEYQTKVAGNIGHPMIEEVLTLTQDDVIALELSSFQLDTIATFRPDIAILLNLTPDHLDRHKTMSNYLMAKANLLKNQLPTDKAILNQDDEAIFSLKEMTSAEIWSFSQKEKVSRGIYLKDEELILVDKKEIPLISIKELQIKGKHNVENAMAASLAAYLFGVSVEVIRERLASFKAVSHRMEAVRIFDEVSYVNDSKGTNPDATIKALESYESPIVVLLGGKNKGSDFTELSKVVKATCRHAVLLGEAKEAILQSLEKEGFNAISLCETLEESILIAKEKAQAGDVVLLSPACASWDMFNSYEERGDLFKKVVMGFE